MDFYEALKIFVCLVFGIPLLGFIIYFIGRMFGAGLGVSLDNAVKRVLKSLK